MLLSRKPLPGTTSRPIFGTEYASWREVCQGCNNWAILSLWAFLGAYNFVSQYSKSFDFEFHCVSWSKLWMRILSDLSVRPRSNCPRSEHFSRLKLDRLRCAGYHLGEGPVHLVHIPLGELFPVDFGSHLEVEPSGASFPIL